MATKQRIAVLGYIRVSVEKQADEGVSLEAQRAKLRAYAELYDVDLVEIVEDAGKSASSLDRPGIQSVLARLRSGEVKGILVAKLDRLTRSIRDLGELLERAKKERWRLMSVGEQFDTSSAAGRLLVNLLGVISQWEREAIGERTSAAMQWKKQAGEFTGGKPPYGYRISADGVRVEPEPAEQEVIATVRSLRNSGLGATRICRELTRRQLLSRNGRPFIETQVVRILATAEA